jgi:hypothetical protein
LTKIILSCNIALKMKEKIGNPETPQEAARMHFQSMIDGLDPKGKTTLDSIRKHTLEHPVIVGKRYSLPESLVNEVNANEVPSYLVDYSVLEETKNVRAKESYLKGIFQSYFESPYFPILIVLAVSQNVEFDNILPVSKQPTIAEKFSKIFKRKSPKKEQPKLVLGKDMSEEMLRKARGATNIKMFVTPSSENPLFKALPDILESLPPNGTAQIIYAIPKKPIIDEESLKTMNRVQAISDERSKQELEVVAPNSEELRDVDLQLRTELKLNNLSIFIQDPKNPDRYWFRKINIKKGSMPIKDGAEIIPYIDVAEIDMGKYSNQPCPLQSLEEAIKTISGYEAKMGENEDPELREMQAVVGVAKYTGAKELSIDEILKLTAVKYAGMQSK